VARNLDVPPEPVRACLHYDARAALVGEAVTVARAEKGVYPMEHSHRNDELSEHPEAWLWDEHGPVVSGTFVHFARGQTRDYGKKVIAVLDVGGEQRSIWLTATVLFGKFRDELLDRPGHRLEPGERITVKRLDKVESAEARGAYWNFAVLFHNSPQPSEGDLFGFADADADSAPPSEPTSGKREDDGIPF
jgi:hypothetical protein